MGVHIYMKVIRTHDDVLAMVLNRLYCIINPQDDMLVVCRFIVGPSDYWLSPIQASGAGLRKGTINDLARSVTSKNFRIIEDD